MYVNGEFVANHSDKWIPVYDPSTEEIIAEVPAGAADVERDGAARGWLGSRSGLPRNISVVRLRKGSFRGGRNAQTDSAPAPSTRSKSGACQAERKDLPGEL
jgi:hypothetical protein